MLANDTGDKIGARDFYNSRDGVSRKVSTEDELDVENFDYQKSLKNVVSRLAQFDGRKLSSVQDCGNYVKLSLFD
jgi:hypothetical protein